VFQPIHSESTADSCRCEFIRTEDIAHNRAESTATTFHAPTNLDTAAIAKVQAQIRQRILRAFVRRGIIDKGDRAEMMCWEHGGGFSLDAPVRGPPLWELELAQAQRQAGDDLQWDSISQPEPVDFDQRAAW
jgi:hypothetical protein